LRTGFKLIAMKTVGWFALVLPFVLCCSLVAQQNSTSPRKGNDPQPTASRPGPTQQPQQPISRGFVVTSPKTDPSHTRDNHRPPHNHSNGGYAYYPYYAPYAYTPYNGYAPNPMPLGQTATDRLLANGGSFNRIDTPPSEVEYEPRPTPPPPTVAPTLPATPMNSLPPTTFAGDASHVGEMTAVEQAPAILVFTDGHALEVRNYAVFAGSVIVMGDQRRRIPLTQLDLQATVAANDKAGYTFRIPAVYLK
jgi:hypothetical protein